MRGYPKQFFSGDQHHKEHSSLLSCSSEETSSDFSKPPSTVGLYQGFGYTVTSQSHIPEEEQKLLIRGQGSIHDTPKTQLKLLESDQHITINIPEDQMEIPDLSFQYLIETVSSQGLFSSEPRFIFHEDSAIDMLESLQELSDSSTDP